MNVIRKKNKTAAWMVSHCSTISGRDELTEKLQSLNIDVDVYGKCGTKQCPRNSPKCQEMLNSDYFFYFSFENTLCNDYITEKVFSVLNNYVVPVVFNGAQMKRFLPPKSYINVENFEKIEDLANYLKYLTENIDEYLEYFWWKKFYDVIPDGSLPLCQMCEKINEFSSQSRRKQVYENIFEWFYSDQCRRSKIRF
jgi:alpha-1,3-fucosyltransferase